MSVPCCLSKRFVLAVVSLGSDAFKQPSDLTRLARSEQWKVLQGYQNSSNLPLRQTSQPGVLGQSWVCL